MSEENKLKLPNKEIEKVRLYVRGDQGIIVTLYNDGVAMCSTHMGLRFHWNYMCDVLTLEASIDSLNLELSVSKGFLSEIVVVD
jgi:hypothetical protein